MEPVTKEIGRAFGVHTSSMKQAPPPPPPAPPPAPDITAAADRARVERESADVQRRKRGRSSTVITGPGGVGDTPTGRKTLVGS